MTTAASVRRERRPLVEQLKVALMTPVRAMRLRYLPLLMIYYAYGALGLVAIAEAFWVKEALTFTPAELASPLDHQDGVRPACRLRADLRLPAACLCLYRRISRRLRFDHSCRRRWKLAYGLKQDALYVTARLLIVAGVVLQDVIADAMTTEVVDRVAGRRCPATTIR
jgi:hypothetical protein